ncbi:MAG: hypothetical protein LBP25_01230 [Tannerellaceae bacterium]|jgi:hypothetical protein|nr:hypothetical protein [Tannerellaceae bacterium]
MNFTSFTFKQTIDENLRKACKVCEEVLLVLHNLTDISTLEYMPEVAQTLNRIGSFDARTKAMSIYRRLVETSPQKYLPDLVSTLTNQAVFYQKVVPQKGISIIYAEEAISHRSSLKNDPNACSYIKKAEEVLRRWNEE